MSNNISINQETLDNLTYYEFTKNFLVYSSQKEARQKNFEAHHIIPISIQLKEYNSLMNTNLSKKEFTKLHLQDDRCYRLTCLEHTIVHYLLAKELKGDYIKIFYLFLSLNKTKFSDITIDTLIDFSKIREKAILQISQSHKNKTPWNKGKSYSIEYKLKLSESHKGKTNPNKGKHFSEQAKLNMSKSHIGKSNGPHTEETKTKISLSNKKPKLTHWYTNGETSIYSKVCPEGFKPGRIIKKRV